ncbi:hypothetical protein DV737_g1141, partial [Chaetothyriales sp. CBS 132003]
MAKEAFDEWVLAQYEGIFFRSPFALVAENQFGRSYIDQCTSCLDGESLPWQRLENKEHMKRVFPTITGPSTGDNFYGYCNFSAGWADAQLAIAVFRDRCLERGVSFVSGLRGTVSGFQVDPSTKRITAVETEAGNTMSGDMFILAAGAWTSRLVSMYNSTLATGQVLGFIKLTEVEMKKYRDLPICINFTTGWFCFPPHPDSMYLKFAVHGWGYTHTTRTDGSSAGTATAPVGRESDNAIGLSAPPHRRAFRRTNFAPEDGVQRLRQGLQQILPELSSREFDRTAVCWYTDTPTGDFIMDFHPDHPNLFLATGGSGQ